jgi:hypothetical protein
MPEMLPYCGRRLRVYKRADKTCDTIGKTGSRRMRDAVHLEDIRCDGNAHGGCQAGCLIFWKEAWLKRPHESSRERTRGPEFEPGPGQCTEDALVHATRVGDVQGEDETFSCQATELLRATSPLPWWNVPQYVRDIWSGNVGLREAIRTFAIAAFNAVQRRRRGAPYPLVTGKLTETPAGALDLQPGELVQVKSKAEIEKTLNARNRNRGLLFDTEMVPYCGGTFRVLRRVEKIIDERTGLMRRLPNDCIVLQGVTCRGHYSRFRLFCPRSIYPYWREIWLRRAEQPPPLNR